MSTTGISWAFSPGSGHQSVSAYGSRDVNQSASTLEQLSSIVNTRRYIRWRDAPTIDLFEIFQRGWFDNS